MLSRNAQFVLRRPLIVSSTLVVTCVCVTIVQLNNGKGKTVVDVLFVEHEFWMLSELIMLKTFVSRALHIQVLSRYHL